MACPFELTKDGIESQFGTNHVGHFYFTMNLMSAIEKAGPGARIVNVSSEGHTLAPSEGINFEALETKDPHSLTEIERYGVSKLCNILFTQGLVERYGHRDIFINSVHPGLVRTELLRGYFSGTGLASFLTPIINFLITPFTLSAHEGALTALYCATSPEIVEKRIQNDYFVPIATSKRKALSEPAKDLKLAAKLWDFTEKLIHEAEQAQK